MKKERLIDIISSVISVISLISYIFLNKSAPLDYTLFMIVIFSMSITISRTFFRVFKRTPSTLSISILGYPNSGKTVYLTVLFNELLTGQYQGTFRTYGTETIERITSDYKILKSGNWLPPTPAEGVFYYRAIAALSRLKSYKLEIADYAGEKFKNDLNENNNYFHKTDFFKYVMTSDAVVLAIDTSRILLEKNDYITTTENSFIAALTLMQEQMNIGIYTKIKFPVAIIFMKVDLLWDNELISENELILQFNRLINFCNKACSCYKTFFVSSVGVRFIEGMTNSLVPSGVIDPIVWLMRYAK